MRIQSTRSGIALIEIVAMLSLLTAVTAASLSVLSYLTEISRKTTSQSLFIRETRRFADQFRHAVHRASEAVLGDDGKTVVMLDEVGNKSEFRFIPEGVSYQSRSGDSERRDLFQIELRGEARFVINTNDQLASSRLIQAHLRSQRGDRYEWSVDAKMRAEQ
jgi:hypothetical protein